MNRDVEQAAAALAAGRRDEAAVYAWNALITATAEDSAELSRIAEELGDARLQRELERRGLASRPRVAQPTALPRASLARRLLGFWPALVFGLFFLLVVVGGAVGEPGELRPRRADATGIAPSQPILAERSGVWLVPLGEPKRVDVDRLTRELTLRYRIPVGALPDVALPRWTLDEDEPRFVGERLLDLLERVYLAHGSAVVIGLTDYDMYSEDNDLAHTFSLRRAPHYGVVSTSPLGASLLDRIDGRSRHERTRKLVARNIGFLFLGRSEVDDRNSLLRSQMSSVHDIDRLEEDL